MRIHRSPRARSLPGCALLLLAGCVTPPGGGEAAKTTPTSAATPAPASPAAAQPSAPPAAFNEVVVRAGEQLLRDAPAAIGGGAR